jgi:hypothetical protein
LGGHEEPPDFEKNLAEEYNLGMKLETLEVWVLEESTFDVEELILTLELLVILLGA